MTLQIDPEIQQRAKWRNRVNTWLIMGGMTLLFALCALVLFGGAGLVWALALGFMIWFLSPRVSPELVLRMYRARRLTPREAPDLHRVLQALADRAGLPASPALYYVPSSNMNAFAVGRPEQSAIAISDGLIRGLDSRQLIGVLGHEVSHVANDDIKVMGLADVVTRVTSAMQTAGILLLLFGLWQGGSVILAAFILMIAPMIGLILQLALSRSREYDADLTAAELTGDPAGLASALKALERKQGGLWEGVMLPGGRTPDPSWLRTHPPIETRVARLLELVPRLRPRFGHAGQELHFPAHLTRIDRRPRYHLSGLWY